MLALNSVFISAFIGATCCGYAFLSCSNSSWFIVLVSLLFFLHFSMVKSALQSVLPLCITALNFEKSSAINLVLPCMTRAKTSKKLMLFAL